MSVATDLQTTISWLSAAIAGKDVVGRVELERIRRDLSAIREEAGREHSRRLSLQHLVGEIADAAAEQGGRLIALARSARAQELAADAGGDPRP